MTVSFSCFHVPKQCEALLRDGLHKTLTFENHGRKLELKMPELLPTHLEEIIRTLKLQQQDYLQKLRTNDVIDLVNEAVHKWLDPQYELRQFADQWLPVITGYDPEMTRLFLQSYLRQFRKEKLQRMVDEDFSNPLVLDEFRPRQSGGLFRAYGPALATHVFSGNVPALPLWSLTAGLLVKSATLGKISSSEPLFPVLFAKTLQEIEPKLGETMAMVWWKGGDEALELASFSKSEAVIAYGGDETIEAIKQRIPSRTRFITHGHKVSFGVITNECLVGANAWKTAKLAALDASWFDQQGCLSPHVFYVERGGKYSPKDFAQMLANEMANFQSKHPRAPLTKEEHHAILKKRASLEFESYSNQGIHLLKSEQGTNWTVVLRESFDKETEIFPFSPLNRFVTVIAVDELQQVKEHVKQMKGYIQTVGIGCSPQRFYDLIEMLGECGVNRMCALGSMPQPQPGWHHDGRFHLADLVHFCDVEASLEYQMDTFDPYRD
ncbi:acyl-CoA reductase [Halalkalibacterium ligniniphilum]|uniref:acyl-CoA reductase n=1 Tax=Halalkalibacterium ligniniphilum TaxID=1134413 RepID=UPI000347710E|nr:acyl-CoA reductase [Halalkalibacterium ligniniphilum]